MLVNKTWVDNAVDHLTEHPRVELDLEIAVALPKLYRVYEVAREMVHAKTHEHSRTAYMEMIDLVKGKDVT